MEHLHFLIVCERHCQGGIFPVSDFVWFVRILYIQESEPSGWYLIFFPVYLGVSPPPEQTDNDPCLQRPCWSTSVGGFEAEVGGLTFCCWEITRGEGQLSCPSRSMWHFHWGVSFVLTVPVKHVSWHSTFKSSSGLCQVLLSWRLTESPVIRTDALLCFTFPYAYPW